MHKTSQHESLSSRSPPTGLWVVRDLQLLHKAWREPGEVARTLQSQNNSPPRPSPFSSRKKITHQENRLELPERWLALRGTCPT